MPFSKYTSIWSDLFLKRNKKTNFRTIRDNFYDRRTKDTQFIPNAIEIQSQHLENPQTPWFYLSRLCTDGRVKTQCFARWAVSTQRSLTYGRLKVNTRSLVLVNKFIHFNYWYYQYIFICILHCGYSLFSLFRYRSFFVCFVFV